MTDLQQLMGLDINTTCCFTGHRPKKLYGYDLSNPQYQVLAKKVRKYCKYLYLNKGVRNFISGGALGFDTVCFFAVESLKKEFSDVVNILAIPNNNQTSAWINQIDVDRYIRMIDKADYVQNVNELHGYKVASFGGQLNKRNHFMVDNSKYLIACWNGDLEGGTYNCITYAKKHKKIMYNIW